MSALRTLLNGFADDRSPSMSGPMLEIGKRSTEASSGLFIRLNRAYAC